FVAAYDIKSGRQVWKAYSTGPDAEMLMDPDKTMTWTDGKMAPVGRDSSLKTWQGDQWKIGGGTTWGWYSYDPKLNLMYYGSGNPSTWNPVQRPGDNKWSLTIWARDVNTKQICPAALGTKDQQPAAYNPANKMFYVPTNHVCMDYEPFKVEYTAGQPYVGATLSMFPAPDSHGGMGNFIMWDAGTGKI